MTRLHIGGKQKKDGWQILNVEPGPDVDYVGDCCDLGAFADESLDAVYASHVIEHVSHNGRLSLAFGEINRVLKAGGRFYVAVPDFEILSRIYFLENVPVGIKLGVVSMLFGGQSSEHDVHRCAFDRTLLTAFLEMSGFGEIEQVKDFGLFDDTSVMTYQGVPISLNLQAVKVKPVNVSQPTPAQDVLLGPIRTIPDALLPAFSMNERIPIVDHFLSETSGGELHWTKELFEHRRQAAAIVIDQGKSFAYDCDVDVARMLKAHSIAGCQTLVIGSVHPFYEAMAVQFGAVPSTVEYRRIRHDIPGIRTYTTPEFEAARLTFDAAISISSIEHDGLGRYGDPIDPDGDLKAMLKCKTYVRKGGLLFLAVPVGRDALCWNAHRIYGRLRLPRLLEGWKLLDSSGFSPDLFDAGEIGDFVQPVFVLENI